MSLKGVAQLAALEGVVVRRYVDSEGIWTIGLGHTKNAGGVDPFYYITAMSIDECIDLFLTDKKKYERRVNKALKGKIVPQHVFDGLCSFDYNTGAVLKASFVPHLLKGDMREARRRFMFYKKPKTIVSRRKKEEKLIFDGKYSLNGSKVPVYTTNQKHKPVMTRMVDIRPALGGFTDAPSNAGYPREPAKPRTKNISTLIVNIAAGIMWLLRRLRGKK